MAEVMTFTSLQADIRRYIERGSSVDTQVFEQIPRLINIAERKINRALKVQGYIVPYTSDLVAGTSVYQKPDRWRDTVSMFFGTGTDNASRTPIFPRSYEYVRGYWPDPTVRGVPEFYADYDYNHWIIAPTPVANYPWETSVYEQPPYLDAVNQTNWVTDYAPGALLHATLLEAAPFLGKDERIGVWQQLYDRDMADLNGEDLMKIIDRSVSRQEA